MKSVDFKYSNTEGPTDSANLGISAITCKLSSQSLICITDPAPHGCQEM